MLWLLFEDSSRYENEYGDSPKYEEEQTYTPAPQPVITVQQQQAVKETSTPSVSLAHETKENNSAQTIIEIQNIDYNRLEIFIQKLRTNENILKLEHSFNDYKGNLSIEHKFDGTYKLLDEIRLQMPDSEVLSLTNQGIIIRAGKDNITTNQ